MLLRLASCFSELVDAKGTCPVVCTYVESVSLTPLSLPRKSPDDPSKQVTYYYPTPQNNKNPIVRLRMYDVLRAEIITGADEALNPLGKQDREYITSVSFPNA